MSKSVPLIRSFGVLSRSSTRPNPLCCRPQVRFQSSQQSTVTPTLRHPVAGGAVGAGIVLVLGYGYYHFSGAKAGVDSLSSAHAHVNSLKTQLKRNKDTTPDSNEAIQWLRDVANSYAGLIPGGRRVVDSTFREIDEIRRTNGEELEKVLKDAYHEMDQLAEQSSWDMESLQKGFTVLMKYLDKIQDLAVQAGKNVLERHPGLDQKYGSKLRKLQQMGEQQGGDAKAAAEEAFNKVQNAISKGGFDQEAIGKAIQEAFDKAQGVSQDAWSKALDRAQPYLKKTPELKEKLEKNADTLIHSDFKTLVKRLQDAASTGNLEPLKQEVDKQLQRAQGMSDEMWKGAVARASLYLDRYPQVQKLLEDNKNVMKKVDFEEFMDRIRLAKENNDISPVKEYIERQVKKLRGR